MRRLTYVCPEEVGCNILDTMLLILIINDADVSGVDAIVERSRQEYSTEIKAGRIDVNGIRRAYVNTLLLGPKPVVAAEGFDDNSVAEPAGGTWSKVIQLSDQYIVDAEELEMLVREAFEDLLFGTLFHYSPP